MLTTPIIVDREPRAYVAVRRTIALADLASVAPTAHDEVIDFVRQNSDGEPGAPFIKYNLVDMEGLMELEFGVPIASPLEPTGELFIGELPAGRYATVTHTGSYDELYDVTSILVGWAKERGIEWDSQPEGAGERFASRIESYLNDPSEVPEALLVTELDFKVKN